MGYVDCHNRRRKQYIAINVLNLGYLFPVCNCQIVSESRFLHIRFLVILKDESIGRRVRHFQRAFHLRLIAFLQNNAGIIVVERTNLSRFTCRRIFQVEHPRRYVVRLFQPFVDADNPSWPAESGNLLQSLRLKTRTGFRQPRKEHRIHLTRCKAMIHPHIGNRQKRRREIMRRSDTSLHAVGVYVHLILRGNGILRKESRTDQPLAEEKSVHGLQRASPASELTGCRTPIVPRMRCDLLQHTAFGGKRSTNIVPAQYDNLFQLITVFEVIGALRLRKQ